MGSFSSRVYLAAFMLLGACANPTSRVTTDPLAASPGAASPGVAGAGLEAFPRALQRGPGQAPSDHFFRMRAFPRGRLDHRARIGAIAMAEKMHRETAYADLRRWSLVGPTNIGGRITDMAVDPTDPDRIFAAAADGGLLRSLDGGDSWEPLLDKAPTLAAGSVAIDPGDPEVIWLGTGEVNPGGGSATFPGLGVFRSSDGGEHWEARGLAATRHIGRIVVDPSNSKRVFVAAMGALYGTNPERGVYRTSNAGETWEQVLAVNDSTGCIDISIDPRDPDNLLAATWERIRRPESRRFGGLGCGVWRSQDGGDTWERLANGLPKASKSIGRIGVAHAPSDPAVAYVIYADEIGYFDGVYRTANGGDSWTRVNDWALEFVYSSYGWWFGNIRVAPDDPDRVFVLGFDLYRSIDGGDSWSNVGWDVHVDHHAMAFSPTDPDWVVLGNDGGIYTSGNGGSSWEHRRDQPVTQFYTCEIDPSAPHRFYGGTQDNGTLRTYDGGVDQWASILGGDGFYVRVDPSDNRYVYAEYQWGGLNRSSNGGWDFDHISPVKQNDRVNWNAPFILDHQDPSTIYFGANRIYRSTNRGSSWRSISDDLTQGPGSGNLTYGTVTSLDVSPRDSDYIYVGTDDGNVALSRDRGSSWKQVGGDLPERWVTRVSAHPGDPETFFVALSGFKWDENISHLYRTENGGSRWDSIGEGLPDASVNDILVDPMDWRVLYVATDVGVFTSTNHGRSWRTLGRGLPRGVVMDLALDSGSRTLAAATFGRSMWALDLGELSPPRRWENAPSQRE